MKLGDLKSPAFRIAYKIAKRKLALLRSIKAAEIRKIRRRKRNECTK